jgi:hypothetical protein
MSRSYAYGAIREGQRNSIYALRVRGELLDPAEAYQLMARMREMIELRGELSADVVVVQGGAKETLRLFGTPYSVNRVRAAMFNAGIRWTPIEFDENGLRLDRR